MSVDEGQETEWKYGAVTGRLVTDWHKDMQKARKNPEHTDIVLSCSDGTTFKAHKGILCAHSEFFAKAFQPDKFKEGNSNTIELEVGESRTISRMLDYIYTGNYDARSSTATTSTPTDGTLFTTAKLYVVADFYMVPSLKKVTTSRFGDMAFNIVTLKGDKVNELPSVLRYLYDNTDTSCLLRVDAVERYARHCFKMSSQNDALQDKVREAMTGNTDLCAAWMSALADRWKELPRLNCQECNLKLVVTSGNAEDSDVMSCPSCNTKLLVSCYRPPFYLPKS